MPTPREILIGWANDQDNWARAIASEVLVSGKELPEETLTNVYQIFLAEKELTLDEPTTVPPITLTSTRESTTQELRLLYVKDVTNVNILAPQQEITFNKTASLFFGENASGKSGYVRILKRLAAVRSAEPILDDFRSTSSSPPHSVLGYKLGSVEHSFEWNDETGIFPFSRISIFDSRAVSIHVDEDLTYTYTPADLALFRHTHAAADQIKNRLERDQREKRPAGNPFVSRFARDTVVYPKVESLGPFSDLQGLSALANVTPEEAATIEWLRNSVEALRPQSIESRLELALADKSLYNSMLLTAKTILEFDSGAYNEIIQRAEAAKQRYTEVTDTAFAGEDIPGVLSDSWRAFVQSGENYITYLDMPDYPLEGAKCIYCQQDLERASIKLLAKYRDYCNNAARLQLDAADRDRVSATRAIANLDSHPLEVSLERKLAAADNQGNIPEVITKSRNLISDFKPSLETIVKGDRLNGFEEVHQVALQVDELCRNAVAQIEELVGALTAQAEERQRSFTQESAKLRNLEARMTLQALLPEITDYVERAKWASKASTIISSRFPTLLRSLTEASKIASEQLVNSDFERLFQEECRALAAPTVSLDFPGRRGQPARRKTLAPNYRLSDVLSEGEQKVIALADFLAEASLQTVPSPIVFDDPVNSLDYKRLKHVVDRIVRLSEHRQVIVFTHSIWFATELLSRFEDATDRCSYFDVSQSDGISGIVTSGTHPRWDTVSQTKGRINSLLQGAGAASGETQTALIEKAYDTIRTWCEVVVEQELLCHVTQRYQPHVAMTMLPRIKADRLSAAISVILPIFEKACRMMAGHSQPLETLSVRPSLDELRQDWQSLQRALEDYKRN